VEPGNGSGHAKRQIVRERIGGARTTGGSDARSLEENLEWITSGLGPQPIVNAKQDNGPVVIYHARATFGQHGHEGVSNGFWPFTGGLNSLEDQRKEVKGL
jgi:hypothetical protein